MWQNQILSDLSKTQIFINGKPHKIKLAEGEAYKHIKGGLPVLKNSLESSECFYMGTLDLAEQFINQFEKSAEQMQQSYDYENIRFPYEKTIWEYSIPQGGRHGSKCEAIFVLDSKDKVFIWPMILSPTYGIWLPGLYWIFLSKSKNSEMKITGPSDVCEEEKNDLIKTAHRVVSYVLSFLKILSCKNVSQELIVPHQGRQERRRGDKPEYTYRILKVKPLGSYHPSATKEEAENHNRVHFCRGHFKQFFPTKPLFGKYTGLYWWEPHVRGKDNSGFVDKDYEIE
jgi:hypothetical protein